MGTVICICSSKCLKFIVSINYQCFLRITFLPYISYWLYAINISSMHEKFNESENGSNSTSYWLVYLCFIYIFHKKIQHFLWQNWQLFPMHNGYGYLYLSYWKFEVYCFDHLLMFPTLYTSSFISYWYYSFNITKIREKS